MVESTEVSERPSTCSAVDGEFFDAVKSLFALYDLVDLDRDMIREEIAIVWGRWIDVVGEDLAKLDEPRAIEDALAQVLGAD